MYNDACGISLAQVLPVTVDKLLHPFAMKFCCSSMRAVVGGSQARQCAAGMGNLITYAQSHRHTPLCAVLCSALLCCAMLKVAALLCPAVCCALGTVLPSPAAVLCCAMLCCAALRCHALLCCQHFFCLLLLLLILLLLLYSAPKFPNACP